MMTSPQALLDQVKASSFATKAVVGAALLLALAVIGVATWSASRPHFQLLYSGLDAQHAAAVQSALAGGSIRYEVSQPPAPFVIHVDEEQFYAAQNLVALAGALESAPEGIQTNGSGASQVFLSAPERAQNVLKREWQELEKQLEELDFVLRAHVSTSTPDPSPLRRAAPLTVAVTLALRGGTSLDEQQASTVAKLVRYRFNVPEENVVISDQSGRSLYDGSSGSDVGAIAHELFEHQARYDAEVARTTNQVLDRILGPGMGYVVVQSEWRCEESESVKETLDPKPVVVSKTESKTSTSGASAGPNSGAGGVVGTAANLTSEFGTTNAAVSGPAENGAGDKATTQETKTASVVGRATEHKRSSTPTIERLSVSLFLDASLEERLGSLESSVKTAVGFVAARDTFSSMVTPFASIERDDQGQLVVPAPIVEEEQGPNRMTELLVERGLEALCALAFLVVLFKSLKSVAKTRSRAAAPASDVDDPRTIELLARTQVEELVKNDPERIGSILSHWAAEEEPLAKAGR